MVSFSRSSSRDNVATTTTVNAPGGVMHRLARTISGNANGKDKAKENRNASGVGKSPSTTGLSTTPAPGAATVAYTTGVEYCAAGLGAVEVKPGSTGALAQEPAAASAQEELEDNGKKQRRKMSIADRITKSLGFGNFGRSKSQSEGGGLTISSVGGAGAGAGLSPSSASPTATDGEGGHGSDGETLVASSPALTPTAIAPVNDKGKGKSTTGHLRAVTEEPGDIGGATHINDATGGSNDPSAHNTSSSGSGEANEEPTSLAEKLRGLIDSLPLPTPGGGGNGPARKIPIPKNPKPPPRDETGKPIPPPPPTPISDSRLIDLLSSATFMNGGRGGAPAVRPSIFSILDRLGAPHHEVPPPTRDPGPGEGEEDGGDGDYLEDATVMLCSPIIPTKDDLVELAESEVVTYPPPLDNDIDPEEGEEAGPSVGGGVEAAAGGVEVEGGKEGQQAEVGVQQQQPQRAKPSRAWTDMLWPLNVFSGAPPVPPPPITPVRTRRARVQTQRVWKPSTTKLSLQAMWWGYRLYLPPPVLVILSDKQLEATKRAALITSALTWFFTNLPISSLPIAIQPALILLQRLVPYLSYIGTFISWSWSTIKSYDVGYGVILTATWLLPFALIPGTWEGKDFPSDAPPPTSPTSPKPAEGTPLPPPPNVPVPKPDPAPNPPAVPPPRPESEPETDSIPSVDAYLPPPPAPVLSTVPLPDDDDDADASYPPPSLPGSPKSYTTSECIPPSSPRLDPDELDSESDSEASSPTPPDEGLPISPVIGSPVMGGKKKPFWGFGLGQTHKTPSPPPTA